jgi:squalene synthase HpnC
MTALLSPPGAEGGLRPQAVPIGVPPAEAVMARARGENFPVASRLLPRSVRADLLAIYGFARLVDQLGDEATGDRRAHLDWLEAELDRAYEGRASHPVMARLGPTLRRRSLPRQPFADLIEANRRDQDVRCYPTFADLVDYCRYSANPVGRLVLIVLGASTPERQRLSDRVCTGLQLVEHAQDVGEDARRGRVYLPQEDLEHFGCPEADLLAPVASPALRAVIAFQAARARTFLDAGALLAGSLPGRAQMAVAGFAGGGLAALDSMERADFDVLSVRCRPTPVGVARRLADVLVASRRTR